MEPGLWKMERFRDFLEARKELLAAELNRRMEDLLHGDTRWLASATAVVAPAAGPLSDRAARRDFDWRPTP